MGKNDLQTALEVIRSQRAAIEILETREAQHLEHIAALEKGLVDKFGAHGLLITQYSNPNFDPDMRRKAAIGAEAYEKPDKANGPRTANFYLYGHLEAARLAKRQKAVEAKTIDVTPVTTPGPAA
jgi:hypothetical protein